MKLLSLAATAAVALMRSVHAFHVATNPGVTTRRFDRVSETPRALRLMRGETRLLVRSSDMQLRAAAKDEDDSNDEESSKKSSNNPRKKPKSRSKKQASRKQSADFTPPTGDTPPPSKEDLVKAVGEQMRSNSQRNKGDASKKASAAASSSSSSSSTTTSDKDDDDDDEEASLLDYLNPFKAGQKLRRSIDTAVTSLQTPSVEERTRQSIYYLDDRFLESSTATSSSSSTTTTTGTSSLVGGGDAQSALDRLTQEDYVPEVLVIGATGEVGRLVVRQLLLRGLKVRVLVRDLYTKTLQLLGTGVTYCQGDLNNMDSLEYAVTEVDKIVFCASAPRPDEDDFQEKFTSFMQENLETRESAVERLQQAILDTDTTTSMGKTGPVATAATDKPDTDDNNNDDANAKAWEQLGAVLQVRANLAEQVDLIGMQNLVRAYQHVRHADYGTSQAAKRSLFKFQSRPADFDLFAIDQKQEEQEDDDYDNKAAVEYDTYDDDYEEYDDDEYQDEFYMQDAEEDIYADDNYDDDKTNKVTRRRDESIQAGCQWVRNQFKHGVFVGRVPKTTASGVGGEAAICSTRFRGRDDPENGIDLSSGFAGFICRVCSDGGRYEAFVRTADYYERGIEYVCEFSTVTKPTARANKSKNKFTTVRLPFASFQPVQRLDALANKDDSASRTEAFFDGSDVRNLGFRYRSASNVDKAKLEAGELSNFYLALSYMKLYRSQPEPEFVYLSDARIPPMVRNGMVSHKARQLVLGDDSDNEGSGGVKLLDDSMMNVSRQSPEEIYFKFRGEETLKASGLSYAIIRVGGYNESPTAEASTIDLVATNNRKGGIAAMSRAEVAEVCARALLDPRALNKSFYVCKKPAGTTVTSKDEDMAQKFSALPADVVV